MKVRIMTSQERLERDTVVSMLHCQRSVDFRAECFLVRKESRYSVGGKCQRIAIFSVGAKRRTETALRQR